MKKVLILAVLLTTGCSVVINGSHQTTDIDLISHDGSRKDVICRLENPQGTWKAEPHSQIKIRRDGGTMSVLCEDESTGEEGRTVVTADYKYRFILPNVLLYGIFAPAGILVDGLTGSAFKYPEQITVEMTGGIVDTVQDE